MSVSCENEKLREDICFKTFMFPKAFDLLPPENLVLKISYADGLPR